MMANYIRTNYNLSITKSCRFLNLSRANYYRPSQRHSADDDIASALKKLASRHKRWGCDKMIAYLKNEGHPWNHKRIRRIYNELALNIRVKPKRHFAKISPERLFQLLKFHLSACFNPFIKTFVGQ
jgi:putative transposase